MDNIKSYKLTGYNSTIDFSADAKYIIIGGYDGGFKVFDTANNKICCKTKLKGAKSDIDILHTGSSFDNKYAAFSALWKIFVMDLQKGEIIWEFEFSKAERRTSSPFCFFNKSSKIVIPNGDNLLIYNIETQQSQYIKLPDGAGWTDCLTVSPDDALVAYKSCNDEHSIFITYKTYYTALDDRVFIYNTTNGKLHKTINVPYPQQVRGQISISKYMKFVDNDTLLIQRKAFGLSWFNINTGVEKFTHTWEQIIGLKPINCSLRNLQISDNGRYILFNKETPDPKRLPDEWVIPIPDGLEYILYDIAESKILFRHKNGESPATFHFETQQFAFIKTEYDENFRCLQYLCIGLENIKKNN
ncbi:MAG: hypothetical protein LBR10_13490 [Prevotellaceae bacterium]|jgi:hypothetical protein|nr:hypothetical protein [Prevotellaceae bacterium]